MALPADFNKIYGSTATGGLTPISGVNYAKGWEFVGANPPTKNDFSYLQNLSDLKSQWLYSNKLQRTDPFGDIKSDGAEALSKAFANLGLTAALAGKASGDLFYDTAERVGMRTRDKQFLISVGADGTVGFWSEAQKKFVFLVDSNGQLTKGIIPASRVTGLAEIGVGQTWRDMSAQRTFNTVYTNSTGKPISVSVTGRNQTKQTYTELWVGDVMASLNYKDSNSDTSVSAIIPAGAVYRVVATGGTLLNWAELS